jgi:hypothetical protein
VTIREYMIELLKAIEAAIPPPANCHHCVTCAKHGSDSEGWTDKLALQVNREGKFYCFFLEENDLAYDAANIQSFVAELVRQMELPDSSFQMGVGLGRYL